MNDHLTDITLILDRSGSMGSIADDVVGGVNEFITQQQAAEGDARFTLVQFDTQDPFEVVYRAVDIRKVDPLKDFNPRAGTPLLDAVGTGIVTTGERLAAMPEAERPARVVFVIVTDGAENSSREYTADRVRAMIQEQQETYGWQFVFLAADAAAFAEAGRYGFSADTSARTGKTGRGIKDALSRSSRKLAMYRKSSDAADLSYSVADRAEMQEEVDKEA